MVINSLLSPFRLMNLKLDIGLGFKGEKLSYNLKPNATTMQRLKVSFVYNYLYFADDFAK